MANLTLAPRWASSVLQLGNTAYVDCGTPTVLNNLTSFTLEAWVNVSSLNGFQSVVGNVDNAVGGQYQLFLESGYVYAYVGIAPYLIKSTLPITVNEWHHLASVFDGTTSSYRFMLMAWLLRKAPFRERCLQAVPICCWGL